MINDWILVALHLLSHSRSTITSKLDNTKERSHNTDNRHSMNLLRLSLHPLTLGYCRQRLQIQLQEWKILKRNVKCFSDRSAETYSSKGLRGLENKGNCLWCSSGHTLHCLQNQSTPELIVQSGLKNPKQTKNPNQIKTLPQNFRTTCNLFAYSDGGICICPPTDIAHSHSDLQELCFLFSDTCHHWLCHHFFIF